MNLSLVLVSIANSDKVKPTLGSMRKHYEKLKEQEFRRWAGFGMICKISCSQVAGQGPGSFCDGWRDRTRVLPQFGAVPKHLGCPQQGDPPTALSGRFEPISGHGRF